MMEHDSSREIDLLQLVAGAQLPAMPQSAIILLELSQDPDNGPAEFAAPIEADPGLTSQVLRFVNSSYFGFSREISNVKLAITLVGIRTIKNFALWSAVFSLMPNPRCGPFDLRGLWQDSLRRALFARRMARILGQVEPEEAFAAALLQDMAVPLLAKELPEDYLELLDQRETGARLSTLEQARFGWTHADAGRLLAENWKLPEEFATLIGSHCQLVELLAGSKATKNELAVSLSSLLPSVADADWRERNAFLAAYRHLIGGAASPSLEELFARLDAEFEEFAPILKLTAPPHTLVQSLAADEDAQSHHADLSALAEQAC